MRRRMGSSAGSASGPADDAYLPAGRVRARHITLEIRRDTGAFRLFGNLALTYLIVPETANRCRLLVKIAVRYPQGLAGAVMRMSLPWGDLIILRRPC